MLWPGMASLAAALSPVLLTNTSRQSVCRHEVTLAAAFVVACSCFVTESVRLAESTGHGLMWFGWEADASNTSVWHQAKVYGLLLTAWDCVSTFVH